MKKVFRNTEIKKLSFLLNGWKILKFAWQVMINIRGNLLRKRCMPENKCSQTLLSDKKISFISWAINCNSTYDMRNICKKKKPLAIWMNCNIDRVRERGRKKGTHKLIIKTRSENVKWRCCRNCLCYEWIIWDLNETMIIERVWSFCYVSIKKNTSLFIQLIFFSCAKFCTSYLATAVDKIACFMWL